MHDLIDTALKLLNDSTKKFFGLPAVYTRGARSIACTAVPESEWTGQLSGIYQTDVKRSLWSIDLAEIAEIGLPMTGDLLSVTRGETVEAYKVVPHTTNKVSEYKHNLNHKDRVIISTQEI